MESSDWENLAARAVRREDEAIAALYADLRAWAASRLRTTASSLVKRKEGLDDLVEAFVCKVFSRLHTFRDRGPGSFLAWVGAILRNFLIDAGKRWLQGKRDAGREVEFPNRTTLLGLALPPGRKLPTSPSEAAVRNEEKIRLPEEMAKLSPDDRRVLELHFFMGFKVKAIAAILGISDDAAAQRLSRAKARLARRMGGAGDGGTRRLRG